LVGLTKKENTHQGPGSIARPLFVRRPMNAWPSDEKGLATLGQAGSFRVHQFLK